MVKTYQEKVFFLPTNGQVWNDMLLNLNQLWPFEDEPFVGHDHALQVDAKIAHLCINWRDQENI